MLERHFQRSSDSCLAFCLDSRHPAMPQDNSSRAFSASIPRARARPCPRAPTPRAAPRPARALNRARENSAARARQSCSLGRAAPLSSACTACISASTVCSRKNTRFLRHGLGRAPLAERDHRRARGHRLQRRDAEVLLAREHERPASRVQRGDLVVAKPAGEPHLAPAAPSAPAPPAHCPRSPRQPQPVERLHRQADALVRRQGADHQKLRPGVARGREAREIRERIDQRASRPSARPGSARR